MKDGLAALSERERQALRLLLGGHDAKSIARELGLSVHTVNERLRDARRKLGVSSSREAARLLGEAERATPNSLGDKDFGVASARTYVPGKRQGAGRPRAWLAAGVLVMSLIIAAAVVLSSALPGSPSRGMPAGGLQATAGAASESASAAAAREWVALVDARRWEESWRAASTAFRSQVSVEQWAAAVTPVRQPLGIVSSRIVENVTRTNTLPGAPAGEYELVQFQTVFAQRSAIETVVMMRERGAWKVAGYFIR